ncbi:hypothetical protein M0804_015383, partial [Polistes exclamans]
LSATGLCAPYCLQVDCAFDLCYLGIANKPAPALEKCEKRQKYEAIGGSSRA